MGNKGTKLLNFYDNLSAVDRNIKKIDLALDDFGEKAIHMLGDGKTPGSFSKKAAQSFKIVLQDTYYGIGEYAAPARSLFTPLNRHYGKRKAKMQDEYGTIGNDILLLTGTMANSIQVIDYGQGRYGVGISNRTVVPPKYREIGGADKVITYAKALELGLGNNPARPLMLHTFRLWLREEAVKDPAFRDLFDLVTELAEKTQEVGADTYLPRYDDFQEILEGMDEKSSYEARAQTDEGLSDTEILAETFKEFESGQFSSDRNRDILSQVSSGEAGGDGALSRTIGAGEETTAVATKKIMTHYELEAKGEKGMWWPSEVEGGFSAMLYEGSTTTLFQWVQDAFSEEGGYWENEDQLLDL